MPVVKHIEVAAPCKIRPNTKINRVGLNGIIAVNTAHELRPNKKIERFEKRLDNNEAGSKKHANAVA